MMQSTTGGLNILQCKENKKSESSSINHRLSLCATKSGGG